MKKYFFLAAIFVLFFSFQKKKDKRPNILFAISDDQSWLHTSMAGSSFVNTPAFDKVANEGIYFTNCYAGSPGCAPSRSALVTGRHQWQNEQAGQHASSWLKKYVPYIDELEANGYQTGRTGKGVGPFRYAKNDSESEWRNSDAGGIEHSNIQYTKDNDPRTASGIGKVNYFANFQYFMENVRGEKPFFFWYGGTEPHRVYEKDSWKRTNKQLKDVTVPDFLPDNEVVRGDLLDYAVEIEWFDTHLGKMLQYLEEIGELENTIVIVTADNGKPFPRAKANAYEYGIHVPLAIRYPKDFGQNRVVNDMVGFTDFAPTILELTQSKPQQMMPISGRSFVDILKQNKNATKNQFVFSGRERHSSSRFENWGYPQRAVRGGDYLLVWNMKPERWPSGSPQKLGENGDLFPKYGLNDKGEFIADGAFTDIDDCPTKSYLIEHHEDEPYFFNLSMAKRPEFEMYNVENDPSCLNNLSNDKSTSQQFTLLKTALIDELNKSNDPRVVGPDKEVFDSYLRYSHMRAFPKP
ncbi:uncharacterized sulfatase [Spirosomataceae bacterium TFI 002]|nr:uncharacterized sulfatase [Spirosomataceae bacterium TFI 002]